VVASHSYRGAIFLDGSRRRGLPSTHPAAAPGCRLPRWLNLFR